MKKKTGVICYLANKGLRNYFELLKSIYLLKKNFLIKYKYDVIIFHESNYSKLYKYLITYLFKVKFELINLNKYYEENKQNISIDEDLKQYSVGYRSMCLFFFSEIFKLLDDYKYYCRLDTDSFITNRIEFDFFDFMDSRGLEYGYIAEIVESKIAVKNIDNYLNNLDYLVRLKKNNIDIFNNDSYNLRCFYTNFEIIDMSIMRNEYINKFVNDVINSNNIFNYRWGDAPLRTIMISLFIEKSKIVRFRSINYTHQIFTQKDGNILDENIKIIENNKNPIAGIIA
jgi:alpha 1,2-mannosyltransferase